MGGVRFGKQKPMAAGSMRKQEHLPMTEKERREQAQALHAALRGLGRALTTEQIEAGEVHEQVDISYAAADVITIPLRHHRASAFIVNCRCSFCEVRRTSYLRS